MVNIYYLDKKYNNADFHHVTVDIQFYLKKNDNYQRLYFISPREVN